jgi:hypothetical protein
MLGSGSKIKDVQTGLFMWARQMFSEFWLGSLLEDKE